MLRNLLSVWTNFQTDTSKHLEIKSGKLSRGKGMSVKKLELDVSCQLRDVYTRFQVHISEHVERKGQKKLWWLGALLRPPPKKNCPVVTKISTIQDTCYALARCIYQVSMWYPQTCTQKSPENFSLAGSSTNPHFRVFLSTRGPEIAQPLQKFVGVSTFTM